MRQKKLFAVSAVCYLLSSASVLPMGMGDYSGKTGSALLAFISAVVFWLLLLAAVTAQLILRRRQKPYRRKRSFAEMALSPPTVLFEAGFFIALIVTIVLALLNTNGFLPFFLLFIMLSCFELAVLTIGKFRRKDGKTVFMIYPETMYLNRRDAK